MSIDSTIQPPATHEQVDQLVGRLEIALGDQWVPSTPKWVTRAPGRLDVMAGSAEYTGSLVLSYPVAAAAMAVVAPRDDQQVLVYTLDHQGNGADQQVRWPLAAFYQDSGALSPPPAMRAALPAKLSECVKSVAAALYALLHERVVEHFNGGVTVVLRCGLTSTVGAGAPAAQTAAVLWAFNQMLDSQLEPLRCAQLASEGQNRLWQRAQGLADTAAVLLGKPSRILQLHGQTGQVLGYLPLPPQVALTGIDSGARIHGAHDKYMSVRTASFMGCHIIRRILEARSPAGLSWQGHLSQLTVNDYVERLRDRLPTKIKGRDYLERLGPIDDPLTEVDPEAVYKVRSRTEHHIYENARARRFIERLSRALRTSDRQTLIDTGELMYASHWSYGQRCGLGSVETDRLVNLLRHAGPPADIFGARVSAHGAGGTVVVLHGDTDRAREAIRQAVEQYADQTSCQPHLLTGTSPGACDWGVRELP